MTVTQKQLAECLGLSLRRVQQLKTDGIIHKDEDVKGYDLAECVQSYIEYKVTSETGRKRSLDFEETKLEHARIKMEISKLKLKRLQRESFDAKAIEASWTSFLVYISGKLDAFPAKAAFAIAGMDTNEAIATMDEMMQEIKSELAEYDPESIADDPDDLYDDEDEDEDDYDDDYD